MCLAAPHSPSAKLISSNFAGIFGAVCVCCQAINYREGKEGRYCVFFSHTHSGRGGGGGGGFWEGRPSSFVNPPPPVWPNTLLVQHQNIPTVARQRRPRPRPAAARLSKQPIKALTFILKSALGDSTPLMPTECGDKWT